MDVDTDIQGYDIDPEAIAAARANAREAGVEKLIHLQVRPVSELSHPKKYGFIITNPPYGERLSSFTPGSNAPISVREARERRESERAAALGHPGRIEAAAAASQNPVDAPPDPKEIAAVYHTLGERYRALDSWSMYLITSYDGCEKDLGIRAAKNRKIYNGMLRTYFYMFPGPKPGARNKA